MDCLADVDQGVTKHIAVIGGGWAGLACAVELAAAGARTCVFEASRQLGGRARRVDARNHVLDNGQHILIGAYRETLRLMRLVGSEPERVLQRLPLELNHPRAGFRLRLPRTPAPLNLVIGLITAKGCSLSEKLGAARFMRALQAINYRLGDDISVAQLLDLHRQKGAIRRLMWEPLCLAALNTPPERASAQIFANVLRDSLGGERADTDLLLPNTDLSDVFPDAAARFIAGHGGTIRLSQRVERIDKLSHVNGQAFDDIVIATAPQHAVGLLQDHPQTAPLAHLLSDYCYEPIGTVYLGYPSGFRLPLPMLGMETGSANGLGQWIFDKGQLGGVEGVVGCVLSAKGAWDERDNDALAAILHNELQETLGRPLPRPLWHQVIRERRATFSCRPGLPRPASRTPQQGLWLAGDYICAEYPATLESAVRSGVATARAILGQA